MYKKANADNVDIIPLAAVLSIDRATTNAAIRVVLPLSRIVQCSTERKKMKEQNKARNYQLTINNPDKNGFSKEKIIETLLKKNPIYFCFAYEIGSNETLHIHIYVCFRSPMMFATIKKAFAPAHIEPAYGTAQENRDYITKTGKWENTEKAETSVAESFFEYGDLPKSQDRTTLMAKVVIDVENGLSTAEIIKNTPNLAFRVKEIDTLRDILLSEIYSKINRDITVIYVYGDTGMGKTYSIFSEHEAIDVCRITTYQRDRTKFDQYHGQPVLVFEEYRSQIPLPEMLSYLDKYPLLLPARYNDHVACYTKVYIVSNIPLEDQYHFEKLNEPQSWEAFIRRISIVRKYTAFKKFIEYAPKEDLENVFD